MISWCGLSDCGVGSIIFGYQTLITGLVALFSAIAFIWAERFRQREAAKSAAAAAADRERQRLETQVATRALIDVRISSTCRDVCMWAGKLYDSRMAIAKVPPTRKMVRDEAFPIIERVQTAMDFIWEQAPKLENASIEEVAAMAYRLGDVTTSMRRAVYMLSDEMVANSAGWPQVEQGAVRMHTHLLKIVKHVNPHIERHVAAWQADFMKAQAAQG